MPLFVSQQKVLDAVKKGKNVFVEGPAGCGKSFLISEIVKWATKHNKAIIVAAPTGRAAQDIGGATIHSQFKISTAVQTKKPKRSDIPSKTDIILIDEISMVRIDVFDMLMQKVEIVNKKRLAAYERVINGKRDAKKDERFAPIQIVLLGDFFQLPPVVNTKADPHVKEILEKHYKVSDIGNAFAFQSQYWHSYNFLRIKLNEVVRQKNPHFIEALNQCRIGNPACVDYFNDHAAPEEIEDAVWLVGTNKEVDRINKSKLKEVLNGKEPKIFKAKKTPHVSEEDVNIEPELKVGIGARVMTTVNDVYERYVNGSVGTVTGYSDRGVDVHLDNGKTVFMQVQHFPVNKYKPVDYIDENGVEGIKMEAEEIGYVDQVPLRLAYAMTIHKAQGCTLEKVNVHPRTFADGQLYVALSRVKRIDQMYLAADVTINDVRASSEVIKFTEDLHYNFFGTGHGGKRKGAGRHVQMPGLGPKTRRYIPDRYWSRVQECLKNWEIEDGFLKKETDDSEN